MPIIFISYSWDSPDHKAWVESLAKDLVYRGIDVLLDVWEVRPGGDLADFMDNGIRRAERVLMICTDNYVEKSNNGKTGGVAYEKQIVRAELYEKLDSHKFVPVIRGQAAEPTMPNFMGIRMYVDFRDDAHYTTELDELARELHGLSRRKPPLGTNPYAVAE